MFREAPGYLGTDLPRPASGEEHMLSRIRKRPGLLAACCFCFVTVLGVALPVWKVLDTDLASADPTVCRMPPTKSVPRWSWWYQMALLAPEAAAAGEPEIQYGYYWQSLLESAILIVLATFVAGVVYSLASGGPLPRDGPEGGKGLPTGSAA